jgi:hypothetical protein
MREVVLVVSSIIGGLRQKVSEKRDVIAELRVRWTTIVPEEYDLLEHRTVSIASLGRGGWKNKFELGRS